MPPDQSVAAGQPTGLRTRLGILTLVLLVSVQFIVIIDTSIVNVTLPSIQTALHFSQQSPWAACWPRDPDGAGCSSLTRRSAC